MVLSCLRTEGHVYSVKGVEVWSEWDKAGQVLHFSLERGDNNFSFVGLDQYSLDTAIGWIFLM